MTIEQYIMTLIVVYLSKNIVQTVTFTSFSKRPPPEVDMSDFPWYYERTAVNPWRQAVFARGSALVPLRGQFSGGRLPSTLVLETPSALMLDLWAETETDSLFARLPKLLARTTHFGEQCQRQKRRLAVVRTDSKKVILTQINYLRTNMRSLTEGTIEVRMTLFLPYFFLENNF